MAKKVLIISTSIRPNSNSEMLANAFADGAGTSGNEVEIPALIGISALQRLALRRRGT
jgi:multimeric flavodoxin WrbA